VLLVLEQDRQGVVQQGDDFLFAEDVGLDGLGHFGLELSLDFA